MATIPVKQDIFRFVTFRTSNKILSPEFEILLAQHPKPESSYWEPVFAEAVVDAELLNQLIENFTAISSEAYLKEIYSNVLDVSSNAFLKNEKISSEIFQAVDPLSEDDEVTLFDNVIYQVFTKKAPRLRERIAQLIATNYAIRRKEDLQQFTDKKIVDIKVVIPTGVIDAIKPVFHENCNGEMRGVVNLGIADFRRVEQEVCCYVPGEVSHIENVMAKEYKERSTRNFVRTEDTTESTRETEIENLTDTTTATRHELSSEVAKVLDEMKTNDFGGSLGVSANWGTYSMNANMAANFSSGSSSSLSNTESKQYAEEITAKALDRIVQKTSEKRTSKIIKEFEETFKHGYDNRNGEQHVTGVYRWIDIIYKNNLVNYGKRMLVEFMVPEPAEFFKRVLNYKTVREAEVNPEDIEQSAPKTLAELGINSPNDITRDNYSVIAQNYGVVLNAPLEAYKVVNVSMLPPCPKNSDNSSKSYSQDIMIEPDYEGDSVSGKVDINYTWHKVAGGPSPVFKMDIGAFNVTIGSFPKGGSMNQSKPFGGMLNPKYTGSVSVNFDYKKMNSITASIELKCKLKASKYQEWQNYCYQQLLAAYNALLDGFNNAIDNTKDEEATEVEEKYVNPAFHRIIEQRELKRICVEMLMKPFCREQGRKNYTEYTECNGFEIPQINQSRDFAGYTEMVRFFEQAIDWQLMSYLFYPYYWADKCDWAKLLQEENDDPVFQSFLQSGMARVVVPIRLSFSEAFALYLDTGDIAMGNTIGSSNYLSIVEELQTIEGTVEDTWETRVPTTLAIIQGKSAFLEQEGLPCCHTNEDSGFIPWENTLQNILPTSNP
ncbi:hypothetical protein [Chryseobacterium sp. MFBS3-17]|uniref:hypothetical protein n=1 Tax=Chryseobacterium sp. MFBS3-17 TaxID=2886689 RepID=UPI001D0E4BF2|nr:hypothetical protein [Chryseobacterium sp. MFBS3-17]MCC2590610.1 hypothetical protein [Chryseobacterium sp. MFBS3-17]